MSELRSYYERFLQTLQHDIDAALRELDPEKRSPKGIAELLKLASAAEEELLKTDTSEDILARLSPEARKRIDDIIKEELGI
jgi:hypothetical protein